MLASLVLAVLSSVKPLTAMEILGNTKVLYGRCSSYADSGEVSACFLVNAHTSESVLKRFSTLCRKPGLLRFESNSGSFETAERIIVWTDGNTARSWWSEDSRTIQFGSIGSALTALGGMTSQACVTLPDWLLPGKIKNGRLGTFRRVKLLGEQSVEGRQCYTLYGTGGSVLKPFEMTICIDKKSFLVRKIFETENYRGFSMRRTTYYRPVVNISIATDRFAR